MSFDIFFQTARYTGAPVVKRNPFTGEDQTAIPNEPLTTEEVRAVREVLEKVNAQWRDEGCCVVEFKDGGVAEVFADELKSGCMVALRGITPMVSQLLFDLLKAGNWVMLPAMEDAVAITASPDNVQGLPDSFPRLVACDSAKEAAILLSEGVEAWQAYRDRVIPGGS